MLKYLFIFFLIIHGLLHLMGFAKAFDSNITQLTKAISKSLGTLWMLATLLFIATAVLFFLNRDSWPVFAIVAILFSQLLIISVWTDAKFGTIANFIILLVAIPSFATIRFNTMPDGEAKAILAKNTAHSTIIISKDMLNGLPAIVQQWLTHSGIVGKPKINTVCLQQKGELMTKPNSGWMQFNANQYFTTAEPAFVWTAKVHLMPLIDLNGRDKFVNGQGGLLIKAAALFTVAKAEPNEKINSATMIRYLAEISWFPTAALNSYIKWEAVDSLSARATMTYKDMTVSGIFHFNGMGDLVAFTADRYLDSDEKAVTEKWVVDITGYKDFNGIRVPYKNKVTWKLKTGDFNWANIELTSLKYNTTLLYQ